MTKKTRKSDDMDIYEFFVNWTVHRPKLEELNRSGKLDADKAAILEVMIKIMDRVGPHDLGLE